MESGHTEKSLGTYRFLVRCSIPERLSGLAKIRSWQVNIHDMLGSIPAVFAEGMDAYFDTIDYTIVIMLILDR